MLTDKDDIRITEKLREQIHLYLVYGDPNQGEEPLIRQRPSTLLEQDADNLGSKVASYREELSKDPLAVDRYVKAFQDEATAFINAVTSIPNMPKASKSDTMRNVRDQIVTEVNKHLHDAVQKGMGLAIYPIALAFAKDRIPQPLTGFTEGLGQKLQDELNRTLQLAKVLKAGVDNGKPNAEAMNKTLKEILQWHAQAKVGVDESTGGTWYVLFRNHGFFSELRIGQDSTVEGFREAIGSAWINAIGSRMTQIAAQEGFNQLAPTQN